MSLRTPLANARGLGAAGEGVGRWWQERLTALALVPLVLWLAFSIALMGTADYYTLIDWLAHPVNAVLMILTLAVAFWHGAMGVQAVVEDYVATEWLKLTLIILAQFGAAVSALAGIFAVLRIALAV